MTTLKLTSEECISKGGINANVSRVEIFTSDIPLIPSQLFTAFPNMNSILISSSVVRRIQPNALLNAVNLISFGMTYSQIQEIQAFAFAGAFRLNALEIFSSQLESIHETAFDELSSLRFLFLERNRLTQLPVNVFRGLISVTHIFLDHNQLTSLDGRIFEANTQLNRISLQNNQINAVGENFFNTLVNLHIFNFLDNICASNTWTINGSTTIATIREAMTLCFDNFVVTPTPEPEDDLKKFTLELRGSLIVRDENDNIVLSI